MLNSIALLCYFFETVRFVTIKCTYYNVCVGFNIVKLDLLPTINKKKSFNCKCGTN